MNYPDATREVVYNVTPESYGIGEADNGCSEFFFQTTDLLPDTVETEFEEIQRLAFDALDHCLGESELPRIDEFHDPVDARDMIGECRGDRTLDIALTNENLISQEFIITMQRRVLAPLPLWRIRICADDDLHHIVIYPDSVSVGIEVDPFSIARTLRKMARRSTR